MIPPHNERVGRHWQVKLWNRRSHSKNCSWRVKYSKVEEIERGRWCICEIKTIWINLVFQGLKSTVRIKIQWWADWKVKTAWLVGVVVENRFVGLF